VPYDQLIQAADHLKKIMEKEAFVVDIDDMAQTLHERIDFIIDKEKAALHGISTRQITTTLQGMIQGMTPAHLHLPRERNPLYIRVIMPRKHRSGIVALTSVPLRSKTGSMVPLAELVHVQRVPNQQPIYHKNLDKVVYVLADTAGRAPAEAILDMQKKLKKNPLPKGIQVNWAGEGEWKITIRVFRDMGIAFAAALIGIYILLVITVRIFFHAGSDHDGNPLNPAGHHARIFCSQPGGCLSGGRIFQSDFFHRHLHDRHDRLRRHCHTKRPGAH
jgi:multidrug efflux pump subunit AcrB